MELLLQTMLSGAVIGASYALVAVGLTIVFGIGKVVNFAHGEFFMAAGYGVVIGLALGLPYGVAVLFALLLVAVLGLVVEKVIIARGLYEADEHVSIIVTFALALGMTNVAQLLAGSNSIATRSSLTAVRLSVGDVGIDGQRAITAVAAVLVLTGLVLWLRRTRTGMQLRAVSDNPLGALYSGINVRRIRTLAFVLGVVLAGVAGALLAPVLTVYPTMGQTAVVTAFTVVVLGGLGSVGGAALAGFLVGVGYAFVATYVSVDWTTGVGWLLVIVMLLARPRGLLGAKQMRV